MYNGNQLSSLGTYNNILSGYKVMDGKLILSVFIWYVHDFNFVSASCRLEIWSGENFTGDRAECTGECDMKLGAVGNDRARSAKCTCKFSYFCRPLLIKIWNQIRLWKLTLNEPNKFNNFLHQKMIKTS